MLLYFVEVCFGYRYVVDDSETMISGGGRTRKDLIGKGYMKMLSPRSNLATFQATFEATGKKIKRKLHSAFDMPFLREKAKKYPDEHPIIITRVRVSLICGNLVLII